MKAPCCCLMFISFRVMAGRGRGGLVPERVLPAQGRGEPVPWQGVHRPSFAPMAERSVPAAGRGTKFRHLFSKEKDQGSSITSNIRHLFGDAHRIDLRGQQVPGAGDVSRVEVSMKLEDGQGSEVVKQSSMDWNGLVSAVNQPSDRLNLRQAQAGWTHYEGRVEDVVEEVDVMVEVEEPEGMVKMMATARVEAKVAQLLSRKDMCDAIQGIVRSIRTR